MLLVWGIPLSYLLSSIVAVSPYSNGKLLLLNSMYAMLFCMGAYFARSSSGNRLIQFGIMASGYIIVIYCYMNMFGNAYYPNAVMADQGLRLTAVFQYANTYAAFLIALLVGCLHFILSSRKWYMVVINALMLVPLSVSFLLTLSRGGIVVLPLILLALLPFLSLGRQVCFFLYIGIGFVGGFLITDRIRNISLETLQRIESTIQQKGIIDTVNIFDPLSLKGWLTLLLVSIGVAAIVCLIQMYLAPRIGKKVYKFAGRKWSSWVLPILLLLSTGIVILLITHGSFLIKIFPKVLQQRMESINFQQHSVLERLMMYRDSLKIFADRPILGGGGGAWEALYTSYQGAPYIPRQVHSYYLEYFDETGLVGMLFLGSLLLLLLIFYVKDVFLNKMAVLDQSILYYMVAVSILIHSMLDFEMSYGYISALVFLCLGGMTSAVTSDLQLENKTWRWLLDKTWNKLIPFIFAMLSAVILMMCIYNLQANRILYSYYSQVGEIPQAKDLPLLEKALKYRPTHPHFITETVNALNAIYEQTKDEKYLEQAEFLLKRLKKREPYNRFRFEGEFTLRLRKNQLQEALATAYSRLESNIWGLSMFENAPNWYDRAVQLNYELGDRARENNDSLMQEKYWNDAIQLYQAVLDKMSKLERLPEAQMHEPFEVTAGIAFSIGKIHYFQKDYEAVAAVLASKVNDNWENPGYRELTRWYLASEIQLGVLNKELYDKFIAKYPDENNLIDEIVNLGE